MPPRSGGHHLLLPPPAPPSSRIRTAASEPHSPGHPVQLQADLKRQAAQLDQAENEKHLLRNELASLKASQKELEQVRG